MLYLLVDVHVGRLLERPSAVPTFAASPGAAPGPAAQAYLIRGLFLHGHRNLGCALYVHGISRRIHYDVIKC